MEVGQAGKSQEANPLFSVICFATIEQANPELKGHLSPVKT